MVVFYAVQMIEGVGHMHSKGIMHRDLKLQNILLDKNGYIKICDFGLSLKMKPGETDDQCSGTPTTMAAQIIKKQPYNMMVDWWAIGILLFQLLYGNYPFKIFNKSINTQQYHECICNDEITFPPEHEEHFVSDEMKDLILKLCTKDPTKRIGS